MIWLMEISECSEEELLLMKYFQKKEIALQIIHMMHIKEDLLQWLTCFLIKSASVAKITAKTATVAGKGIALSETNQQIANELQKISKM